MRRWKAFRLSGRMYLDKPEACVAATVEGDPFIAFGSYGKGRSAVITTDCAPHWAPPEFCEWEYYNKLWQQIVDWTVQK